MLRSFPHPVACCCEEFKTRYYLQTDATAPDNVGYCWPTMLPPFARALVLYFIFRAHYSPLFQNTLSEISAAGAQYCDASVYGRQRLSKVMKPKDKLWETFQLTPGGGGGTPIHYLYGYVPPKGVVILKLLANGVSISEAFSRTGYNISNARKLHFCKQPFESIQGQIAFKNTVQCVNKQTVVLFVAP